MFAFRCLKDFEVHWTASSPICNLVEIETEKGKKEMKWGIQESCLFKRKKRKRELPLTKLKLPKRKLTRDRTNSTKKRNHKQNHHHYQTRQPTPKEDTDNPKKDIKHQD